MKAILKYLDGTTKTIDNVWTFNTDWGQKIIVSYIDKSKKDNMHCYKSIKKKDLKKFEIDFERR